MDSRQRCSDDCLTVAIKLPPTTSTSIVHSGPASGTRCGAPGTSRFIYGNSVAPKDHDCDPVGACHEAMELLRMDVGTLHPDVLRARAFATVAHGSQQYGSAPYLVHLDEVATILKPFGPGRQVIGYLHDVLEDTETCWGDLYRMFGSHVACCVELLTDPSGSTRAERKAKLCDALLAVRADSLFVDALIVKAADRLANVRASIREGQSEKLTMYRQEHPHLRAAAFRPGLCDALWSELDQRLSYDTRGLSV